MEKQEDPNKKPELPTQTPASVQPPDLEMKGRFRRYNSPFLELMIPVLTTRYLWLAIEDLNPMNFLKKPNPALQPGFKQWQNPTATGYVRRNFAALGMGATLMGILALYSRNTYQDIKTLYSEAVGYELDKKPENVTWNDIFVKSHNQALEVTRGAFVKRTLARSAAISSFFVPWHMLRDFPQDKPKFDANANAGVGALGTYLSLDGFLRKTSFFDQEQDLVTKAINRGDGSTNETVKPTNIQTLLFLQRSHMNKKYKWPEATSPEGKSEIALSTRIANLLNETYQNAEGPNHSNFTMGKFNFLVGFGLLDSAPTSLAFVELANKSKDMQDVKQAAADIKSGKSAQEVFQQLGIDINHPAPPKESVALAAPAAETKFTDRVQSTKEQMPDLHKSYQDMVTQTSTKTLPSL